MAENTIAPPPPPGVQFNEPPPPPPGVSFVEDSKEKPTFFQGLKTGLKESVVDPLVGAGKAVFGSGDSPLDHPLKSAYDFGKNALSRSGEYVAKTGNALRKGDVMGAVRAAPGMVPVVGPMAEDWTDQIERGEYGRTAGNIAGTAAMASAPAAIPKMARGGRAAMQAGVDAVKTPGALRMAGGAGEVGAGVSAAVGGHPIIGMGLGARGLSDVARGLQEYRANKSGQVNRPVVTPPPATPMGANKFGRPESSAAKPVAAPPVTFRPEETPAQAVPAPPVKFRQQPTPVAPPPLDMPGPEAPPPQRHFPAPPVKFKQAAPSRPGGTVEPPELETPGPMPKAAPVPPELETPPTASSAQQFSSSHPAVKAVHDAVTNKVSNVSAYLRGKGITAQQLSGMDEAAAKSVLDEAYIEAKAAGKPVPAKGYRKLDGETLRMISEELGR